MGVVNSGRASDMFIFALPDGGEIIDPDETYADGGAATLSRVPVTLETRLQYEQTRAGEINQVSCDAFDEAGEGLRMRGLRSLLTQISALNARGAL